MEIKILKTAGFTMTALCLVLIGLFLAYGCEKPDILQAGSGEDGDSIVEIKPTLTLRNTKWKLVGIMDVETDSIRILDPTIECDKCYTLVFDETDTVFYEYTTSQWTTRIYEIDYLTNNIRYISGWGTMLGETWDGFLYTHIFRDELRQTQPFSLQENEFKWYYNDKKNYLLFKPFEL